LFGTVHAGPAPQTLNQGDQDMQATKTTGHLAILVPADSNKLPERVTLPDDEGGAALAAMQKAVGGYIELVRLGAALDMWVNEDGIRLKLPLNSRASVVVGEVILGDVLICARRSS
jgi:hypothetical protein